MVIDDSVEWPIQLSLLKDVPPIQLYTQLPPTPDIHYAPQVIIRCIDTNPTRETYMKITNPEFHQSRIL